MKAHSRFFAVLLVSLVTGWLWAGDAVASQESSVWKLRPWPGSSLVQGLPAQDAARILGDLPRFVQLTSLVLAGNSDLVALVDKAVALPENYVPDDLVVLADAIPGLSVKKASPPLQLRRLALPALQAMVQAARESGIELPISSAYRSYQYQVGLFERYVRESGLAQAERFSARAGHSQHQLGLAIDFGSITVEFADTPAGRWMFAHAAEFGFSLSYPEGQEQETGYMYEPWHYRYIGRAACQLQKVFFADSQQAMLVFLDRYGEAIRQRLADPFWDGIRTSQGTLTLGQEY